MIQPALAATVASLTLSLFDTVTLTLPNKAPFHLSYHAEDSQYDMPHFASGRNVRVKHGHECALLLALMNQVEDIARVPAYFAGW